MRFIAVIALLLLLFRGDFVLGQSRVQFPSPLNGAPTVVPLVPSPLSAQGFIPGGSTPFPTQQGAFLGGTIQPLDPYALPSNLNGTLPPAGFGLPSFGGQAIPPTFPPGTLSSPPPGFTPNWQPPGSLLAPGAFPGAAPATNGTGLPPFSGAPYGTPTPQTRPNTVPLLPPRNVDPNFRGSPFGAWSGYDFNRNGLGNQTGLGNRNPNGFGANPYAPYGGNYRQPTSGPPYQRFFQDTGLRGTHLFGRRTDDLSITEVEASTTAYFANFLGVPNGLRVTPGFAFHWTDGPQGPGTSSVPSRLYSGYLDFGLDPRFNRQVSAELTARVGIYSDFQAFDEDSIRLLGSAVGVFQTTPDIALKLGAVYIDRVSVKLLPAVGFLWTPNPQTRWDIFFPSPKLSNYWTTIGNQQVWWYLGGEYGGGSWSIERESQPDKGREDRIDINDIRFYVGVEWWNTNRYYGFLEGGYVFDREIVYFRVPSDTMDVDDTFMVRGGISW